MSDRYYKWLDPARTTTYRHIKWPKRVGAWTADETPVLCCSGWHLATHAGIGEHSRIGAVLWIAEGRGESIAAPDKIAFTSVRLVSEVGTLTRPIAVRWSAECAERVLGIFEARYPKDKRPRQAIEAALAWAADPTPENAAYANDAAYAANDAAAYAAANAAAYAAYAANDAAYAAYAAANAAAYAANAANADGSAAYAAAHADYAAAHAERTWQADRLLELLEGSTP